ncbi:peptidyl-Lys metalloendopeptidase [Gloeophyllum trabeum ATCC 11539]|uniref:Peptidyl-Lys metalloendopeptidase n=1 Tax=Gloeophyllum trabeum (strain ATCC 11539 / FP-39264 / Madison 617) TaxID=670483 RepID=S7S3C5_GLOTA|nr:peptidyl-Lys metalloendopeptidase [Gloeophyllum trabeum ATCC 11539]EPQ60339.1 peptidyl-Lys metalloendopeptidase [Gloeophyllum trabeum ATCC 11539]
MLSSALLAVAFGTLSASALRDISVKVSGPDTVDGVDNLKVTATITNTGDETLKLLNDPYSPLSRIPTDTFRITTEAGETPQFIGVKAKYVPAKAAELGAYTVLEAGKSIEVEHDISSAYNFTTPGEGRYSFEARNVFYHVDDDGVVGDVLYANHEDVHTLSLSGKLVKARVSPTPASRFGKRESYNGCSSSQKSALVSAAPAAQTYVANALSYLKSHTSSTTRYTTWFGTYTSSRHSTVQTHFNNLNGNDYSSFTYDCTCTDSGTYAYVYPDDFGYITLCGAFWDAPVTGTDSKGGTLVHESSHFTQNGGTQDYVYGQSSAKSLAKSDPSEAIMNADSHEYFAENNPSLS